MGPRRDFTFVSDTVNAFLKCLERHGGPYIIGAGKSIGIGELLAVIMDITGCKKPLSVEFERTRPSTSEVMELCASPNLPDWKPEVTLEEGLRKTVEWWKGRAMKSGGYMI